MAGVVKAVGPFSLSVLPKPFFLLKNLFDHFLFAPSVLPKHFLACLPNRTMTCNCLLNQISRMFSVEWKISAISSRCPFQDESTMGHAGATYHQESISSLIIFSANGKWSTINYMANVLVLLPLVSKLLSPICLRSLRWRLLQWQQSNFHSPEDPFRWLRWTLISWHQFHFHFPEDILRWLRWTLISWHHFHFHFPEDVLRLLKWTLL